MKFEVIKRGSNSQLVGDWQSFLRGVKMYFGIIDNDFGNITHESTLIFQRKYKLKDDGIVGEKTFLKAIQLGFAYNDYSRITTTTNQFILNNPSFPEKPNFSPILGNSNREKIFGKIDFVSNPTKSNPEGITITNDFESKNIVRVNLPALSKATGGSFSSMRWHKSAEYQLVKFFERLEKENLHTRIISYAGAFYPRFIRGSRTQLSNHSWGTAFDINVAQNGLNKVPALVGQKGSVRELVPIANEYGFYWGGHFSRMDGMHFEIAKIINKNL